MSIDVQIDDVTPGSEKTASWLDILADHIRISAASTGDGFITLEAVAVGVPLPSEDRDITLRVGTSTIMRLKFPRDMERNERRFGPVRVSIKSLRRNSSYAASLVDESSDETAVISLDRLDGDPFEAIKIDKKPDFLVRLQNNHTKFASPDVLTLGAKSYYHKTSSLELRAACLTILFHRLIWLKPSELAEQDHEFLRWLVAQSIKVLDQLCSQLKKHTPTKEAVRWTISLATVAGHGAIVGNDPHQAKLLYAIAGGQAENLPVSPVSGTNVVNGGIFSALLEAATGDMEQADKQFRAAFMALKHMVAAHNMLANVWVVGDIAEASLGLRQAMIAMVRLKLISNKNEPMIGGDDYFDVHQIKSPVGDFLDAGFCHDVWQNLKVIMPPAY